MPAEHVGVAPRRREDDGTPAVAGERLAHEIDDLGGLLRLGHLDDLVLQIGALVTAGVTGEADPELHLEVLREIGDDLRLGGRREAGDGGGRATEALADEARDIEVVGAKIVAPFRQAMCFVEYPGRDLATAEGVRESLVAELLGRDQDDARVTERDPVEDLAAFGWRQEAVQGTGRIDPLQTRLSIWSFMSDCSGEITTVSLPLRR